MTAHFVYVTTGDMEEAVRIGRAVVDERLAACANIIHGMRSVFRWQDRVQEAEECVLILKTEEVRLAALTERITVLHEYDCPCVVAWPLTAGNAPFLHWIAEETVGAADAPERADA